MKISHPSILWEQNAQIFRLFDNLLKNAISQIIKFTLKLRGDDAKQIMSSLMF
jgi:hypothetical protein